MGVGALWKTVKAASKSVQLRAVLLRANAYYWLYRKLNGSPIFGRKRTALEPRSPHEEPLARGSKGLLPGDEFFKKSY